MAKRNPADVPVGSIRKFIELADEKLDEFEKANNPAASWLADALTDLEQVLRQNGELEDAVKNLLAEIGKVEDVVRKAGGSVGVAPSVAALRELLGVK